MRVRCPRGVSPHVDPVSDPRHGGDDPRLSEPLAQSRHRDPHRVRERVGVLVPGSRR